ncbi:hypothetical protein GTU99_07385 [Streptomyces sp. PRKS01-65]|nr:hypothetical protein [Streptomyces harenosi]NEY32022.1 hypothetical protein [Streptomyces harenosi]
MPRPRRALAVTSSLLLAASGVLLAVAPSASAATCPHYRVTNIQGAKAEYRLACNGGKLRVYGWVKDTRAEGDFAVLHIYAGNGASRSVFASGWGVVEHFDYTFARTRSAEIRLSLDN